MEKWYFCSRGQISNPGSKFRGPEKTVAHWSYSSLTVERLHLSMYQHATAQ